MKTYPKIQSLYKRDEKTHKFIIGEYSLPEFDYLKANMWEATEKINGTNIRIEWNCETKTVVFGGHTDNAQIPVFLLTKLQEIFPVNKFQELYPETSMTLYGEGYGARIQKGGGNYIRDGVDFILFDILIGDWWMRRDSLLSIAENLDITVVPSIGICSLNNAVTIVKAGLDSRLGNCKAEGLVLKTVTELKDRRGHRIITKMKTKDF